MPRPSNKTKGGPSGTVTFNTNHPWEDEKLEQFGLDYESLEDGTIQGVLNKLIDTYAALKLSYENKPTAAELRYELVGNRRKKKGKWEGQEKGLLQNSNKLFQEIIAMSQWIKDLYDEEGYNTKILVKELSSFIDTTSALADKLDTTKTPKIKGATIARRMIINELASIHENYYAFEEENDFSQDVTDHTVKKDLRERSDKNQHKIDFILHWFTAINEPISLKTVTENLCNTDTPEQEKLRISFY